MRIVTDYLYPLKGNLLKKRYQEVESADHLLKLSVLADAVIVPPMDAKGNECGVVDIDGVFEPLSVMDPTPGFITAAQEAAGENRTGNVSPERVLFAGYFNMHWGHFLMDTISRLWPIFNSRTASETQNISKIVYCLHKGQRVHLGGNVSRVLELLGIKEKIEFISTPTQYASVLVPETAVCPRGIFALDAKGVYDRIVECSLAEFPINGQRRRKLYLSRALFKKALTNEPGIKWLEKWMVQSGYEVVYPEKTDIVELIRILHDSEEVAAVQGTLPHNMVFAPEGCRLTIYEKTPTLNNYQPGVDRIRGLRTTLVDCGAFIRPVSAGLGPFIIYPTSRLKAFAKDREMAYVCGLPLREKRRLIWKYFRAFRRNYHEQWMMADWEIEETPLCCEAYEETEAEFGDWLNGLRAVRIADLFHLRDLARRVWKKVGRLK